MPKGMTGAHTGTTGAAAAFADSTAVVAAARRRGKSKTPNFSYSGPVSVIHWSLMLLMTAVGYGWSGSGRRCLGCGGRCSATPSIDVGLIGGLITSGRRIRKGCGSGWG